MTLPKLTIQACLMSLDVACVSHGRSQLALAVDRVANPDKGTAIVLATVTDKRLFRAQALGEGAGARLATSCSVRAAAAPTTAVRRP